MLCLCGVFALIDIAEAITHPPELHRYLIFLSWWSILAVYETALLLITIISQHRGRPVRSWIWILNTIVECLLLSLGILGLTADKGYLGPYRGRWSPPRSASISYSSFFPRCVLALC